MHLFLFALTATPYTQSYNCDMLQKNLNADMTNPNIYHSIDDNNSDHVYAEIQKDGLKDPGITRLVIIIFAFFFLIPTFYFFIYW